MNLFDLPLSLDDEDVEENDAMDEEMDEEVEDDEEEEAE